jgi:hypothetical protein
MLPHLSMAALNSASVHLRLEHQYVISQSSRRLMAAGSAGTRFPRGAAISPTFGSRSHFGAWAVTAEVPRPPTSSRRVNSFFTVSALSPTRSITAAISSFDLPSFLIHARAAVSSLKSMFDRCGLLLVIFITCQRGRCPCVPIFRAKPLHASGGSLRSTDDAQAPQFEMRDSNTSRGSPHLWQCCPSQPGLLSILL